jgi:hypothetical protein
MILGSSHAFVCHGSVGYGDLAPTGQEGRLFTMFFGLTGISLVALALSQVRQFCTWFRLTSDKVVGPAVIMTGLIRKSFRNEYFSKTCVLVFPWPRAACELHSGDAGRPQCAVQECARGAVLREGASKDMCLSDCSVGFLEGS